MRFSGALTPLVLTCQLLATVAWADDASRTFEWNVNLDGWKVLGPFPKDSDDPTGLITEFVDNESQLRAGRIAFHNRKLLTWRDAPDRVVNLRTVLDINSTTRWRMPGTSSKAPSSKPSDCRSDTTTTWLPG